MCVVFCGIIDICLPLPFECALRDWHFGAKFRISIFAAGNGSVLRKTRHQIQDGPGDSSIRAEKKRTNRNRKRKEKESRDGNMGDQLCLLTDGVARKQMADCFAPAERCVYTTR